MPSSPPYSLIADRKPGVLIPIAWHAPIRQKAGIVAASQNQSQARKRSWRF